MNGETDEGDRGAKVVNNSSPSLYDTKTQQVDSRCMKMRVR